LNVRVVTYNIQHGVGMDGVLDLERVAAVLASVEPDIVALNEVDKGIPRSLRVDQARYLAERLGMEYAFGPNLRYFGGDYGNAVLSRFPIQDSRNVALKARGREPRGLLHVTVDAGGVSLHVLTTHLEVRDPAVRDAQVREIAGYTGEIDGPVILMGDFNSAAGPRDPAGMLFPKMQDAWVLERLYFGPDANVRDGWPQDGGFTHSSRSPGRRIDYVFVSGEVRPLGPGSVRTVPSLASDHLPVVAELRVDRQAVSAHSAPAVQAPVRERAAGTGDGARVPGRILFVSNHAERAKDALVFQQLFAPGRDVAAESPDELAARDWSQAAVDVDVVVLHNQTALSPAALEWLARYRDAGGAVVALGVTGLRYDAPVSFPPDGAVAAALFSVRVAGWTRSEFVSSVLVDCEQGNAIPRPAGGLLHLEAMPGGRPVLGIGHGCDRTAYFAAVAGERTLYVGVDPLAADVSSGLVTAVRRQLWALSAQRGAGGPREEEPAQDSGSVRT